MRFLDKKLKSERSDFTVPRNVQNAIPVKTIYEDGIFYLDKNKYSKCYKFNDINYTVANREDKEDMFFKYSELLNSFDSGVESKITIINRRLNKVDFEKTMLLQNANDKLDVYRKEYNKMLLSKANKSNGIIQEKFITATVEKKNIQDARTFFSRFL